MKHLLFEGTNVLGHDEEDSQTVFVAITRLEVRNVKVGGVGKALKLVLVATIRARSDIDSHSCSSLLE